MRRNFPFRPFLSAFSAALALGPLAGCKATDNPAAQAMGETVMVSTIAGSGKAGYADGAASAAQFLSLSGIAIDAAGNLYVVDSWNHRIRKITPKGEVSTFAEGGRGRSGYVDGPGSVARFTHPAGITIDAAGNLYVTDDRIRHLFFVNDRSSR